MAAKSLDPEHRTEIPESSAQKVPPGKLLTDYALVVDTDNTEMLYPLIHHQLDKSLHAECHHKAAEPLNSCCI